MLRLLGFNPIARALIGVVLVAIGLATHRVLLTVVGGIVLAISAVALVSSSSGSKTRGHDDR